MIRLLSLVFTLLVFTTVDVLAANDDLQGPEPGTIAEIAAGNEQFSTLVSALEMTGLTPILNGEGTFTVFAPTNEAFEALGIDLGTLTKEQLSNILLYHVLGAKVAAGDIADGKSYVATAATGGPGNKALSLLVEKNENGVTLNGKIKVTAADVEASNGLIHIIDAVITPMSIVDHAVANPAFGQLVGALSAAPGDLVKVLSGDGPFTVFAPVNSAFEAIAEVAAGLTPEQLAAVLTYHVVGGANVRSSDLSDGQKVTTVNGSEFSVQLGDKVTLTDAQGNTANVIMTDVQATNGVIHVIDKVILPKL